MSIDDDAARISKNVAAIGLLQEQMASMLSDVRKLLVEMNETLKEIRDAVKKK